MTFPSFTFSRDLYRCDIVGVPIMVLQEVEAHLRASGGSFDRALELCRASTSTATVLEAGCKLRHGFGVMALAVHAPLRVLCACIP